MRSHGVSYDAVQTQMMILRELIAKGEQFSDLQPEKNEMTVFLMVEKNSVTVEVQKPVGESSFSKLNELDKTIQLIQGCQDPFGPYIIKRREASAKLNGDNVNDFELARIAYETGAVIDFYINENNILNLSAVKSLA